jgi:maleate cis-trans isomerase
MRVPRIGVLIPSTNTAVEADYQRVLQGQATLHSERLFIPEGEMSAGHLDEMNRDLDARIRSLATAKVDIMVYACTSGSFYRGPGWDDEVVGKVRQLAGVPCIATSQAVAAALDKVAPSKAISVVTPYPAWTNEKLGTYYGAHGFSILSIAGDARAAQGGHRFVNDQDPEQILEFGTARTHAQAQALFCSCTAWRAFQVALRMERALGKPVVTSNQATVWRTFAALELPQSRGEAAAAIFGRLGHA